MPDIKEDASLLAEYDLISLVDTMESFIWYQRPLLACKTANKKILRFDQVHGEPQSRDL